VVLGAELRVFHLLGRCSVLEPCPQSFLALVIFEIASQVYALVDLAAILLFTRIICMGHHAQIFLY
jgi:hypothetical protein